ncbi:sporulation integral membrane protein YlbJ [Aneurinibacillus aneurinilyticus]|jgi:sporulation integral membrane protein YlbJ|nr:sporulation integral membrane protein YlbJ [Aneurinibacillus aneurinilyticus]MCI1692346.1 sporulation integral membrane protein YlbJ [Aneurinibacillus aneurinilyticus]MED0669271.1 sporulation integral membrane protein YlbJ [Aneurinibacillus aneurinilyticus]MED0707482.1 sporulation integral membrane protein YlbJ [Aneurinibacillus aneurinilyticus]MED0724710.1 sporulation integral membrane protein YlbJ [Aneurinibacillus aneurinilyticus]MED0733160.1 sporulation integral membrane protein YlbJ [A
MRAIKPYVITILFAVCSFVLAASLVLFPDTSFLAALRGLKIWWDVVFPALLPFFITSEILLGLGLAHFMGILLEPLMRPIFNIPGPGSFVWTMGFASGYPISAKLTVRLREQKLISQAEGERLVSYTTTADPVFITGAVAIGFFSNAKVGLILLICHYTTAILVGFIMARHNRNGERTPYLPDTSRSTLYRALTAMHHARLQDGRAFGKLMGDAVMTSLHTQLLLGGFILFFSVLLDLFTKLKVIALLSVLLGNVLSFFGYPVEAAQAFIYGLFEVTLGAKESSELFVSLSPAFVMATASAILAWGGLSVHAQVASMLAETDIRYRPFLFARLCHAAFAFLFTYTIGAFLYGKLQNTAQSALPVWLSYDPTRDSLWTLSSSWQALSLLVCAGTLLFTIISVRIGAWLTEK